MRDGFYFWAFLLGPLWMLWHRLWLVLLIYLVADRRRSRPRSAALGVVRRREVRRSALLIALLVGCEAGTLRRWTLARRRWTNVGLVVGDDLEDGRAALLRRLGRRDAASPPPAAAAAAAVDARCRQPSPDVIGLFPEPQRGHDRG